MKTINVIYQIILAVFLLCLLPLCSGQEPPANDPLRKIKDTLLGDEFPPHEIADKTTDKNRTEMIADLKKILSESLANPSAPKSADYAGRAILAYVAISKEEGAAISATLQPFVNYPDPGVQQLALRCIVQSGDVSALKLLKSRLQKDEANLPDATAFTAQTEKQYQPVMRAYFQTLLTLSKIKTPEAIQLRDQSLARFKTKYEGTDFGPKFMDAYNEGLKRESQK